MDPVCVHTQTHQMHSDTHIYTQITQTHKHPGISDTFAHSNTFTHLQMNTWCYPHEPLTLTHRHPMYVSHTFTQILTCRDPTSPSALPTSLPHPCPSTPSPVPSQVAEGSGQWHAQQGGKPGLGLGMGKHRAWKDERHLFILQGAPCTPAHTPHGQLSHIHAHGCYTCVHTQVVWLGKAAAHRVRVADRAHTLASLGWHPGASSGCSGTCRPRAVPPQHHGVSLAGIMRSPQADIQPGTPTTVLYVCVPLCVVCTHLCAPQLRGPVLLEGPMWQPAMLAQLQ